MRTHRHHFVETILLASGVLLWIVDPLRRITIYVSLTAGMPEIARADLAKSVSVYSLMLPREFYPPR